MPEEFLIGGQSKTNNRRKLVEKEQLPPRVGFRFLIPLVLIGAIVTAAGAYRVSTVNDLRDFEMESARKQELIRKRRDMARTYESRIANLMRVETLRDAASHSLGMQSPAPQEIETLVVTEESRQRWQQVAHELEDNKTPERRDP